MGDIFRAYDPVLRRWVALKVLRREVVTGDAESLRRARAQLLREARAAAVLSHPNAVAIFDVGEVGDTPFLAMELLEGKSLREYIGDVRVDLPTKLAWLADIARALGAAHERGLVHRDVKPENVMVCNDGTIKVLDFGIAKITRPVPLLVGEGGPPSIVTMVGNTLGTPRYMAPEVILGHEVDGRADQFAWGIVAYELLAGKHAWAAQEAPTQYGILNEAPPLPPLETAGLPPDVGAIVMRALEKESRDRFVSMQEVVAALEAAIQRSRAAPPPPRPSEDEPPEENTAVTHLEEKTAITHWKPLAEQAEFRPGEVIDERYELVSMAGRGPHAIVFRVSDLKARTWVALKVLLAGGDEKRLRRELLVARSVTHPGVVRMYDLVEVGGRPALTMELVEGQTLAASLARGSTWSPDQLKTFGLEVASALGAVHAAKVIHTDLRANKILLRTEGGLPPSMGRPVVTGFGSARVLEAKEDPPSSLLAPSTLPNLEVQTLPLNVAPELRDQLVPPGPGVDVYAFGHLWFEAAMGALTDLPSKGAAREAERLLAAARPDLPGAVTACIVRCLAFDPKERFSDGSAIRTALEARKVVAKTVPMPSQQASPAVPAGLPPTPVPPTPVPPAPSVPPAPIAGPAPEPIPATLSMASRGAEEVVVPLAPGPPAAAPPVAAAKVQKKKGKGVIVGLVLAFLLAVAVGASIVLFWGGAGLGR
jgi:serine/threonine protein kinase